MMFTRNRFPLTRTIGVCPTGAQLRPGGAVSDRSPHWSAHAITAPSARARVTIAAYCPLEPRRYLRLVLPI
ncbi:hypothetical protein [Nocardia sp. GAS34]|uniref:hypothetical protein n=1 Tax=unclassified Nocardia TaxID=2637762 RepID=UPI003D23FF7C